MIKKLIRRFRGKRSVDTVLSKFTKTIDTLRDLQSEAEDQAWKIEDQIDKLKDARDAADAEADKAAAMAEKLEAIFR